MSTFSGIAEEITVILLALTGIGGVVYWVLRKNLEEIFVRKSDCQAEHARISETHSRYREDLKEDLEEIKKTLRDLYDKFFDYMRERN